MVWLYLVVFQWYFGRVLVVFLGVFACILIVLLVVVWLNLVEFGCFGCVLVVFLGVFCLYFNCIFGCGLVEIDCILVVFWLYLAVFWLCLVVFWFAIFYDICDTESTAPSLTFTKPTSVYYSQELLYQTTAQALV